jgi:hypothetical protein
VSVGLLASQRHATTSSATLTPYHTGRARSQAPTRGTRPPYTRKIAPYFGHVTRRLAFPGRYVHVNGIFGKPRKSHSTVTRATASPSRRWAAAVHGPHSTAYGTARRTSSGATTARTAAHRTPAA